jgi:Ser/Thr protein kinase RdoA (MazF antagonist)
MVEGYSELRKTNENDLATIEALRTLRMLHYWGWLAKRWNYDPIFQRTFGFFTKEKFWEKVLLDLENQKVALQQADLIY